VAKTTQHAARHRCECSSTP